MTDQHQPAHNGSAEASPSMSRGAEDNLSNSEGPLLSSKRRNNKDRMQSLQQNAWRSGDCSSSEKKNHRCIWTLSIILAVIGFGNLLLNMTILLVLRVSRGMEALEVIPEQDLIKFYGNTDLDRVCLQRGICEGFGDQPIELAGDAAGVHIKVANKHDETVADFQVASNGTSISHVDSFQVKDPRSGSPIFSTEFPNFSLPQGVKRIQLNNTQTHRIAAPKRQDLIITSDESVHLHGAEGASLDSKDIIWTAKNDIFLRSKNGDIVIEAKDNINMLNIPVASTVLPSQSNELQDQYKVCVCMPDGKLFLIPANGGRSQVNCATASRAMESDPCSA